MPNILINTTLSYSKTIHNGVNNQRLSNFEKFAMKVSKLKKSMINIMTYLSLN